MKETADAELKNARGRRATEDSGEESRGHFLKGGDSGQGVCIECEAVKSVKQRRGMVRLI